MPDELLLKLMSQEVLMEQMKVIFEVMSIKLDHKFMALGLYKPIANGMIKYYNFVFGSLVSGNDESLRAKFDELGALGEHKESCLISIMFNLGMAFLYQIMENHHRLNKKSCDEYIADIDELYLSNLEHYKLGVTEALKHIKTAGKCPGMNLKDCKPDMLLFPNNIE
ncbi:MAG: hypothetical protein Hyperionvirus9_73 [Hyperionvirus sp.]|uniref:Uncharacterized protein n=1 Tax=Hyperionvirus sp. TaxID=2487770 RepID=A0A3G5A8Q5_9VIRU|nr:MAG: hypothetical protein Hyperionvirus9_73 [Hyperionvirus sp.]